jgi:tRNA(fMet)-specific endonuclease VapC
MLDTNICSFLIRRGSPAAEKRLIQLSPRHEVTISAITYFELRRGALAPNAPKRLLNEIWQFVERLAHVEPFDEDAAEHAARVDEDLRAKGARIGEYDTLIAGHALRAEYVLVTNNWREFSRVHGLMLEDWSR